MNILKRVLGIKSPSEEFMYIEKDFRQIVWGWLACITGELDKIDGGMTSLDMREIGDCINQGISQGLAENS